MNTPMSDLENRLQRRLADRTAHLQWVRQVAVASCFFAFLAGVLVGAVVMFQVGV